MRDNGHGARIITGHRAHGPVRARDQPLRAERIEGDTTVFDKGTYTACNRPMTPDGPPILGTANQANLYFNSGHGHMGWTMACGTARIVADLMNGRMPELDLEGLTPRR